MRTYQSLRTYVCWGISGQWEINVVTTVGIECLNFSESNVSPLRVEVDPAGVHC